MIWNQLRHTIRKPQVIAKVMIISVLFLLGMREQLTLLDGFSRDFHGAGQINVGVFLIHIFNYFDFYMNMFLIGLVMLVPDFAQEEFLTPHLTMFYKSRIRAGLAQLGKIMVFMFLYLMWFVFLAVLFSGISLHNFSAGWPEFLSKMYANMDPSAMNLIMIPKSALKYNMPAALLLFLLRTYLGFVVLAWVSCLTILMTGKSGYGIGILLLLLGITQVLYYDCGGVIRYCGNDENPFERMHDIEVLPYSVFPFFSFRTIGVNFLKAIRFSFIDEAGWLLLFGVGILLYYWKGDIGDADRNV